MTTCGWCGTKYTEFQPNCKNCGGLLPAPPGNDAGPPPPPAPRTLPPGFATRLLWTRNVFAMVGGIFMLVAVPLMIGMIFLHPLAPLLPLLHCTLGFILFRAGRRKAQRVLNAFVNGTAVKGEITEVYEDMSTTVNNRHPWAIGYHFTARGQVVEGAAKTWDHTARQRQPGQPIWVLYIEGDPAQNTVYPPVK